MFSLSFVAAIALVALVIGVVAGRATGSSAASGGGGTGGSVGGKKIDVIIKASDSSFWQVMVAGAKQAGADFGIAASTFGPTSETNIDEQVQLVENSISRNAAGIVIAPNSSSALNSVIGRARKAGIKVVTVDSRITAPSEGFIGTDNVKAGTQAPASSSTPSPPASSAAPASSAPRAAPPEPSSWESSTTAETSSRSTPFTCRSPSASSSSSPSDSTSSTPRRATST